MFFVKLYLFYQTKKAKSNLLRLSVKRFEHTLSYFYVIIVCSFSKTKTRDYLQIINIFVYFILCFLNKSNYNPFFFFFSYINGDVHLNFLKVFLYTRSNKDINERLLLFLILRLNFR